MTYTQLIDKYKEQEIKITQKKLAEDTGIPIRTIQGWAAAYRTPPQYIIQMIDKILETKYIHQKSTKIYIEQETSPIDQRKDAMNLGHWTTEEELLDIQEDLLRIANKTDNREIYKIVDKLEIILTRR